MTPQDAAADPGEGFARPMVARMIGNRGVWLFGAVLAIAAAAMFSALEARRANLSSPAVTAPRDSGGGTIASPPDLAIPPDYGAEPPVMLQALAQPQFGQSQPLDAFAMPETTGPQRRAAPRADYAEPMPAPPARSTQQTDSQQQFRPVLLRPQPPIAPRIDNDPDRKRATRFVNPGTTVPKGTVIHAVLETALDSTRAGAARAIVSRDVSSFDGSRVLVPKGSKLIGDYESDLARGQNRALIQWHRLMLPSGTIIDVDSPSADPLGRAGVKGKVNTHFFERYGGAILQSALDASVQLATREVAGGTVVLALPSRSEGQGVQGNDVRPTLKIKQGSSVSVFVARDLDFTDVEY